MKIDKMSASGVKKFQKCPKQYYLRYLHEYSPLLDENKYIRIGNSVHESCEDVLEDVDSRDADVLLDELWKNDPEYYGDDEYEQVESCFETAAKYIAGYVDDIQSIEDRWTMDHNGIELIGYCDLVADERIIDWKTGKSEGKELDEKIQASFYIKLYENEFGKLPEEVDFVYLDEGTRSTHRRITEDGEVLWNNHKNTYWEDTQKIINRIIQSNNKGEWEPDPSDCHWCEYKYYCQDSPIGAENVTREHIDLGL